VILCYNKDYKSYFIRMKIIYSPHAEKRMMQRSISKEEVSDTIEFPNYTIKRKREIGAYKKRGNRTLKVVYFRGEN